MRHFLLAALALAFSTGAASAAKVTWQGQIMITAIDGCPDDKIGDAYTSSFSPRNLYSGSISTGTNSPDSSLSFITERKSQSVTIKNGSFVTGAPYAGVGISSRGGNYTTSGQIVSFGSSAFTAASRYITMTGRISNWDATAGCTVTFDGAFVLRR